ncbi:MAG: class I SAM-dependent methyltransferase [Candidatus Helarchaeota archaeon]|nr:class I SAM-dependent methyltransferase [Candidatus Helarchaeota archaeon]
MNTFKENFKKIAKELENLDKEWSKDDIPAGYEKLLTHQNEIRPWSVHPNTAKLLKFFVVVTKAKVLLELGTSVGYSTLWLAWGAKITNGLVYTIELFEPKIKLAEEYFKKAKLDKYIIQIHGEISQELDKWTREVDFIFIDADKYNYLTYFKKMLPYLKKGGIMVADDVIIFTRYKEMRDFVEFVKNNQNLEIIRLNIENGLLIAIKK